MHICGTEGYPVVNNSIKGPFCKMSFAAKHQVVIPSLVLSKIMSRIPSKEGIMSQQNDGFERIDKAAVDDEKCMMGADEFDMRSNQPINEKQALWGSSKIVVFSRRRQDARMHYRG